MNLNFYGSFEPGPWKNDAEILHAINKEEWSPGRDELREFATSGPGHVEGVKDISNLMCSIARHKSVTSINIFTHAKKGFISLHGWVVKGDVIFSDTDSDKQKECLELDDEYITMATGNFTQYSEENRPKSKPITLSDVRKA